MERLDYEAFKPMFGSWAEDFKPFIESEEMYNIYQRLKEDSKKEIIVPSSDLTFRTFQTSFKGNLKVVLYLMDPYARRYKNRKNQATGIPMDCTNSPDGTLQPSLIKFYDAIDKELDMKVLRSPNLEYLNTQGIMLMNTDLTCKLNKTASHEGVWEPFQKFFLEEVLRGTQLIYILAGKASHKIEKYISPLGNEIIKIEHPAFAEREKRDWNSKGIFNIINNKLKIEGKSVMWNKADWDADIPF